MPISKPIFVTKEEVQDIRDALEDSRTIDECHCGYAQLPEHRRKALMSKFTSYLRDFP